MHVSKSLVPMLKASSMIEPKFQLLNDGIYTKTLHAKLLTLMSGWVFALLRMHQQPPRKIHIFLILITFNISQRKRFLPEILISYRRTLKIKKTSRWVLVSILLMSALIHKQRKNHENEIMQHFVDIKHYERP